MKRNFKEHLHKIRTFVFDVDGVFTDGTILISESGELLRSMNVQDGYAVKVALTHGYRVAIISGGTNEAVRDRFRSLGITDIYLGASVKAEPMEEFLDIHQVDPEEVLYMGDDLPDIPAMQMAALATCPQNAVSEVKEVCDYISHRSGGQGCVRDVIEQVLKIRGHWNVDAAKTSKA
jgi:3-deoxy-D-manno-octulosonate 8-phosphate phosphatase (KDO 8-P phosphatase)